MAGHVMHNKFKKKLNLKKLKTLTHETEWNLGQKKKPGKVRQFPIRHYLYISTS